MSKEEKHEQAIEWLENAVANIDNIERGLPLYDMVKDQINNAIKYLNDEEVDDDVFGK